MYHNDNDKLLNIEGWSNQERLDSLSKARIANFIALILSSVLAFTPWLYFNNIPSWLVIFIGVTGIMGLITSSLTFYYFSQVPESEDQMFQEQVNSPSMKEMDIKQDHKLVGVIFTLCGVMICSYILSFLFLSVQKELDQDFFLATNKTEGDFIKRFNLMFYCVQLGALANILAFGYVCFALYIACVKQEDMRLTIHTFNLLFLLSAFLTWICCRHCLTYMKSLAIPGFSFDYIQWIIVICLTSSIISLGVYLINLKKSKVTYFLAGSFILCLLFISSAFHFQIVRDTTELRSYLKKDCGSQLRITSEQYLSSQCHCDKYIKNQDKSYSNQCDLKELGVQWEQDVGKPVNEQLNHEACLNMNCCGVLADSYSEWFYALSFFTACILIFGFGLLTAVFYLSQRPPFINYKINTQDFVFGAILGIIFFSASALQFKGNFSSLPPQKPQLHQIRSSDFPSQDYLIISQEQTPIDLGSECTLLVGYLGWDKMQCTHCKSGQIIRLSVHADNKATIKQSISFNAFHHIQQLPSNFVSQQLFNDPNPDSTISVQGAYSDLSNLFQNYVYLCSSDQTNVQLNFYQVPKPTEQRQKSLLQIPLKHMSEVVSQKSTETPASIKLVELNQIQFCDVKVSVQDAQILQNIGDYHIKITQSGQIYKSLTQSDSKMLILYNIQFGQYTVEISKANYYTWTGQLNVLQDKITTQMHIWITPKLQQPGQIAIQLQWTDPHIQISLAATYNISPTEECTSGLISGPCRDMKFKSTFSSKYQSQTIFINSLEPKDYLVYLQFFPNDATLRQFQMQAQNGQALDETQLSKFNDTSFFKSNLTLSVYSYESSNPVVQIHTPINKLVEEINEPNLTWLALCMDGQVGVKSISYTQDFWDYSKTPTPTQRKITDDRALPTSRMCNVGKH